MTGPLKDCLYGLEEPTLATNHQNKRDVKRLFVDKHYATTVRMLIPDGMHFDDVAISELPSIVRDAAERPVGSDMEVFSVNNSK